MGVVRYSTEGEDYRSPERVFREIMTFKQGDLLKQWVSPRKTDGLCIEPDKRVSECLNKIADYLYTATVTNKKTRKPQLRYKPAQAAVFGRGADAFVIAHAMADKGTVVTFESDKYPDSQRIRIPDICDHFKSCNGGNSGAPRRGKPRLPVTINLSTPKDAAERFGIARGN
jgi:hypothetical protein